MKVEIIDIDFHQLLDFKYEFIYCPPTSPFLFVPFKDV